VENSSLTLLENRKGAFFYYSLIAGFLFLAPRAFGGTVTACERYQTVTVGSYIISTGYWNKDLCPGTQCLSIDDQTGSFTVTDATYSCGYNVAAYPSVLYGYAWGSHSPNCGLPAPLSELKCVNTSWSFQPTDTGRWDAAYDIWLCPDNSCGPGGFNNGAEVMIWLDYRNTGGWKDHVGSVTLDGMQWEVWTKAGEGSGDNHIYVAYLANTLTTSVKDMDIKPFLDDCQARGYVKPSWYLYAVEVGNEIASGGIPFTSKSFSVSVNKDCGAKAVYGPITLFTPMPTPSSTPTVIPSPH
jgi:hypothetical protein